MRHHGRVSRFHKVGCAVWTRRSLVFTLICSDDAFKLLGGTHLFGQLAHSVDSFVCGFASHFLIELLKKKDHEQYLLRLAKLVGRAQLDDDDEMLTNRFLPVFLGCTSQLTHFFQRITIPGLACS
jgi:hypothetical protein